MSDDQERTEGGGHWDALAELLGADVPPPEPASEFAPDAEEPKAEAVNDAPPERVVEKVEKPKVAPPPKSHWQSLAGMLGIGGGVASDKPEEAIEEAPPERTATEIESMAAPAVEVNEGDSGSKDAGESAPPKRRSFWGRRTKEPKADAAPQQAETPSAPAAASEDSVEPSAAGFGTGIPGFNAPPAETDERTAESKSVLDSMFVPSDESFWDEDDDESAELIDDVTPGAIRDEELDVEFVDESSDVDDPLAEDTDSEGSRDGDSESRERGSGYRGRRRQRRSRSRGDSEEVRGRSDGQNKTRSEGDSEESGSDSDGESRPRRRRRRRRGGRERAPQSERSRSFDDADVIEDPVESPSPSDSVLRLEASAALFDEQDEQTEARRRPKRGKRAEEGEEGEAGGRRKSSIPSWQEAVGVIVKRNIGSRSGGGEGGGRTKGSNGRRRRGGRRRRSNSDRRPDSES